MTLPCLILGNGDGMYTIQTKVEDHWIIDRVRNVNNIYSNDLSSERIGILDNLQAGFVVRY